MLSTVMDTYNTSDFVPDELRRLIDIVALHQEIVLEAAGLDR